MLADQVYQFFQSLLFLLYLCLGSSNALLSQVSIEVYVSLSDVYLVVTLLTLRDTLSNLSSQTLFLRSDCRASDLSPEFIYLLPDLPEFDLFSHLVSYIRVIVLLMLYVARDAPVELGLDLLVTLLAVPHHLGVFLAAGAVLAE